MGTEHVSSTRRVAEGLAWPEGPSVLSDGRVVFVETYRSRLTAWHPDTGVEQFAYVGGGPNATALGSDGCVYVTQNGGVVGPWTAEDRRPPSIQRVTPSGEVEIVASEVDGVTLRAPNDLAFGPDGRLYFTDPGGTYDPVARPDRGRVFVVGPDGSGELLADLDPCYPNGIVVEQAGTVVWVESYTNSVKRWSPDGSVVELAVLDEGHVPDGLTVAANGDLYVTTTAAGGLDVLAADGSHVGFVPVGAVPTNCTFDGSTLYVTDGGHQGTSDAEYTGVLWEVVLVGVTGLPLHRGSL